MGNKGIIALFGLVGLIFAIIMMRAGFGLVTSGGNQAALDAAKRAFQNAIIGLLIVMSAWLLVDTLMRSLLEGDGDLGATFSGWGPWSEVRCTSETKTEVASIESTAAETGTFGFQAYTFDSAASCKQGHSGSYADLATCEIELATVKGSVPASDFYQTKACDDKPLTYTTPVWDGQPLCGAPPDPGADGVFSYQPGIAAQAPHASDKLNDMLSCMANKVPAAVGVISSISDSLIVSGTKTWAQCRLNPRSCAHVPTSYHYGNGGRCGDKSYAVDFGDEENAAVLCAAANACGPIRNCSVHNGNHVHLEIPCP
jgi:hypothetical protein